MKAISNPTLRHQCHREDLILIPSHQSPTEEREARRQTSGIEPTKKHLHSKCIKTWTCPLLEQPQPSSTIWSHRLKLSNERGITTLTSTNRNVAKTWILRRNSILWGSSFPKLKDPLASKKTWCSKVSTWTKETSEFNQKATWADSVNS